jgi:methylated-DNA-[protein]-cysteine S-methyltransferase
MIEPPLYVVLPSAFGTFSIVWRETEGDPKVYRIFLSNQQASSEDLVQTTFAGATHLSHPAITNLGEHIQSFLEGQVTRFDLHLMALEVCSEFQRRVLLAEYEIPRGWISTYGRIGRHLGVENGARAVGKALARNPFPIVIPCHRAIRSNGELGGYQGGLEMKRTLLEIEGVQVSQTGKVLTQRVYYGTMDPG